MARRQTTGWRWRRVLAGLAALLLVAGCQPVTLPHDPAVPAIAPAGPAPPAVADPADTPPPAGPGPAPAADASPGPGPGPGGQPTPAEPAGRLAIVIDDMGAGQPGSEELLNYPLPLTYAVLPSTAYAQETAAAIIANGRTLLLHLPMEPLNLADNNPGADAIFLAMSDEEIGAQTGRLLDRLPAAVGVSNHMGSAATADARVMAAVLAETHARGLFFFDSRTTAASVATAEAARAGVPHAANQLFVDLDRTAPAVREMLGLAVERAVERGSYIVIAHPHPSVAEAMYDMLPAFEQAGVALTPLTELLVYPAATEEHLPP